MIPRVLMVDDDTGLLSVMKRGLKPHADKFQFLTAENGVEALEILERESISLVVTDLMMPVMDGFQLLTHMMEKHPFTPRMIMSSTQSARQQMLEENSGIEAFLVKPVTPKELAAKILETLKAQEDETGYVKGISLMSFSQLVELEQKSCVLQVTRSEDGEKGYLFFRDGQLIDALAEGGRGIEAAYKALSWKSVNIAIRDDRPDMPDVIRMPMQTLLMEAAYRSDVSMMSEEDRAALTEEMDEEKLDQFNAVAPSNSVGASILGEGLGDLGLGDNMDFFAPPPPPPAPDSRFPRADSFNQETKSSSGEGAVEATAPEDDDDTVEFDLSGSNLFMVDLPGEPDSNSSFMGSSTQSSDKEDATAEDTSFSPAGGMSSEDEEDFGTLLDGGFDAFREKNYQLAMTLWRRAEELNPEDKRLKYNLKLVAKKLGES